MCNDRHDLDIVIVTENEMVYYVSSVTHSRAALLVRPSYPLVMEYEDWFDAN